MENSSNNNEVLDFNEIEVKNNIKLNKEEYLDTISILDDDLKFLYNVDFNIDFKLNLFLLNKTNKLSNSYEEYIINNQEQNNNNINNTTENSNLINIIRNTELFPGSNTYEPYNFKKKFYGSESISILEHICFNELIDRNNIFKFYFSEIFKKKNSEKKESNVNGIHPNLIVINNEDRNSQGIFNDKYFNYNIDNEIKENNQKMCKEIKKKLLLKIGKVENCIFEENVNIN